METTTLDILKLLVKTLEQCEAAVAFAYLPDDYRFDALALGKKQVAKWEQSLFISGPGGVK